MRTAPFSPTHQSGAFLLRYGHPLPFGASHVPGGINFAVFSANATACTLVLFHEGEKQPFAEIPFPPEFRIGHVFSMMVFGIEYTGLEYGFRMEGPDDRHSGHWFDPTKVLLDPFAKEIGGRGTWLQPIDTDEIYPHRARMVQEDFDWEDDRPLKFAESDLIIYEMHLRGFTRHESSAVDHPGTYAGLIQKIRYLRELGVNCIELMPIFEFNETENTRTNPLTGEPLCNYWGYSTVSFFAPKSAYSSNSQDGGPVHEVRRLVREMHDAGIEVWLDVVYNHTAEQGMDGPTISFRGLDNSTYYMLAPDGRYADYTGCGNTVNCNHPVVREFVLESLRHWAAEYHIDGFRFDLAAVLGRDPNGAPLANPPLLEQLAYDPLLAKCDLVAEAWDAGGLYQVGNFPAYRRWMEWNGKFRDAARRFLRGDPGLAAEVVQRIMGSPDLYAHSGRKPTASVNFLTCHDGYTLRDLYSYNEKHNLANGENNRDGANDNYSWNCGAEGETNDPEVLALRLRMQKNALALLLVSQGVPMISMGDEVGRTQLGNNNAYCHDDAWNWFDWSLCEKNADLLRFTKNMIAFRRANRALRRDEWLTGRDCIGSGYADISWHGVTPWKPDWTPASHSVAFLLCGRHGKAAGGPLEFIYCVFNMFWNPLTFTLPVLPKGMQWTRFADTHDTSPDGIVTPGSEPTLENQRQYKVEARSTLILVGR